MVLNILRRLRAKRTGIGKVTGKQLQVHAAGGPVRGKATAHLRAEKLPGMFPPRQA